MRWRFGWGEWRTPLRVVVGVEMGPEGCRWVVVSGATDRPAHVLEVQRVQLPETDTLEVDEVQTQAQAGAEVVGRCLRSQWRQSGVRPHAVCMGIDDAWVSSYHVALPLGLSPEDVAFQVMAEVQAARPDAPQELQQDVCVDYQVVPTAALHPQPAVDVLTYQVHAVPRSRLAFLQRVAKAAHVDLVGVSRRSDAQRCARHAPDLSFASQDCRIAAEQADVALGLALSAWDAEVFNFLPYRQRAQDKMRHAWWRHVGWSVLGGLGVAAALSASLAWAAAVQRLQLGDEAAAARALQEARQAHAQALQLQERVTEQQGWWQARLTQHQHTLRWTSLLSQASPGVWLAGVTQQKTRWLLEGEALNDQHAQDLLAQLKTLEIWASPPHMTLLQTVPAALSTGLPRWQFRIEAQLKEEA